VHIVWIGTIRDSSNDYVFGKPSSAYAVAGTQIAEAEDDDNEDEVGKQLFGEE
jgi:hypothetical protein